jgi:hypothetical protein
METMSSGNAAQTKPRLWYAKITASLMILGGLCLMLGHSQDIEWLEKLGWSVNYDYAGVGLLWLGGVLMFPHLIYNMWRHWRQRNNQRPMNWIGALLAMLFLVAALRFAPDNIRVNHFTVTQPSSDEAPKVTPPWTDYEFWGFRHWPARIFAESVEDSERHYPTTSDVRERWQGPHNVIFGLTMTSELRRLSPYDLGSMREDGLITDEEAQSDMVSKGYECVTRTDRYIGPFIIIQVIRSMDDLSLSDMKRECQLVSSPHI